MCSLLHGRFESLALFSLSCGGDYSQPGFFLHRYVFFDFFDIDMCVFFSNFFSFLVPPFFSELFFFFVPLFFFELFFSRTTFFSSLAILSCLACHTYVPKGLWDRLEIFSSYALVHSIIMIIIMKTYKAQEYVKKPLTALKKRKII